MLANFSLLLAEFRPCEGDHTDQIEVNAFNCPLESRSLEKAGELFSFWCGSVVAVRLKYAK